jgi:peptidoglycan/LPS O-acetylase OafA/YrhL
MDVERQRRRHRRERKYFFFEKKKQKTFFRIGKVFWFFFSKMNRFFLAIVCDRQRIIYNLRLFWLSFADANGGSSMRRGADIRMVQALRAMACVMVVVYHALQATSHVGRLHHWSNGSAGVDLFFVISGYVMLRSSRGLMLQPGGWRRFLHRRVRRVVPLYWLLTLAKLAIAIGRPGLTPQTHPNGWAVAASLMFVPARDAAGQIRPSLPVGWTLNFEFFFYILFAGALMAGIHPLWLTPILLGIAVAGFWRDASWPAPLFLANGMVLEFAAGMAIARFGGRLKPRAAAWLLAIAFVLLLTLPASGPWRCLCWGLPAAIILRASLALEPVLGPILPAWLLAIGDASYAIYLVHPFVVPALAGHSPIASVASVPVSVAAGLVVHRLVDAPLQHLLASRRLKLTVYAPVGAGVLS